MKKNLFLLLSSFFLAGCFAQSMTLVSTGAGASQGRMIQSSISSVASYGVKKTTGKFPLEHIIIRERQRLQKKTLIIEDKITQITKKQIKNSKEKALPLKNIIKSKSHKFRKNMTKVKGFAAENFKHKPRFSYIVE